MELRLKSVEDLLGIVLNFLAAVCVGTVLDAAAGNGTPLYLLIIPVAAPLICYASRKWVRHLLVFLALHGMMVMALVCLAGRMDGSVLWQVWYAVVGVFYAVSSIRIRVTREEDGEAEMSPALAAIIAAAAFFCCSMLDSAQGCSRILWIALLWIPGFLIRKYLNNYSRYVALNRGIAGTMPEERIFRSGVGMVGGYSALSLFLLAMGSKTSLIPWLSGRVREGIRIVLRALLHLLELLAGDAKQETLTGAGEQGSLEMLEGLGNDVPPAWMQLLEKLLVIAVLILIFAAFLFFLFLLIRFLIRGFYGREKKEERIEERGYVEEEKRLKGRERSEREHLPFIGGTPDKRVRRIFKRTVTEAAKSGEWSGLKPMTARQLAELAAGADRDSWEELVILYERARYAEEEITAEEARRAGKLSRQILHTIK